MRVVASNCTQIEGEIADPCRDNLGGPPLRAMTEYEFAANFLTGAGDGGRSRRKSCREMSARQAIRKIIAVEMKDLGARIYGLAAMIMGIAGLIWGDFAVDWMTVPARLPGRTLLAYVVGVLLLAGGMLINWRRASAWGAAILTAVLAVGLVLLDLTRLAMHLREFAYWESSAEQLALVACGVIAYAASATMAPSLSARAQRAGRGAFGLCLLAFGIAHFVYAAYTASLVPKWLPPDQMFWTYLTGVAQFAAGVAILSGVLALLAARLLAAMYVIFGILVHAPLLASAPSNHGHWIENVLNLALIGAALIVADSLAAASAAEVAP